MVADDLPLFSGPHLPAVRFVRALDRLDLDAAEADAPPAWRSVVADMAAALRAERPGPAVAERLVKYRCEGWPAPLERAWQRLVGRHLDAHGIPGVLDGELAAAFLLRGGERERAHSSLKRHVEYHPRDVRGWQLLTELEPIRGAARCAFHGGPVLDSAGELIDMVLEDDLHPVGPWLLPYAWLTQALSLDELADALRAEGILAAPPIPMPGDGRAFAWYLLDAGGRPLGPGSTGVIAARARLQRVSPVAFQRYLRLIHGASAG